VIKNPLGNGMVSITMGDEEFDNLCTELNWICYNKLDEVKKKKFLPMLYNNELTKPIFEWLGIPDSTRLIVSHESRRRNVGDLITFRSMPELS